MKKYLSLLTASAIIANFSIYSFVKAVQIKQTAKKTVFTKKTSISVMKVVILPGCIGCGRCESISSEVFSVDDISHVNQSKIIGNEAKCIEAAKACPMQVIKIM